MSYHDFLNKLRPIFTPLEMCILEALKNHLDADARDLLSRQVESVNLIQRHLDDREVCCYRIKGGKTNVISSIQFPIGISEVEFASLNFTVSDSSEQRSVKFTIVDGMLFSLIFNSSPKNIKKIKKVVVNSIVIYYDPMKNILTSAIEVTNLSNNSYEGCFKKLCENYEVSEIKRPVSAPDRLRILNQINTVLPSGYLEIVRQSEGFSVGHFSLFGLLDVYEVNLIDGDYYLISEVGEGGYLGVKSQSKNGKIYYLSYYKDAVELEETSFCSVIENFLGAQ